MKHFKLGLYYSDEGIIKPKHVEVKVNISSYMLYVHLFGKENENDRNVFSP